MKYIYQQILRVKKLDEGLFVISVPIIKVRVGQRRQLILQNYLQIFFSTYYQVWA